MGPTTAKASGPYHLINRQASKSEPSERLKSYPAAFNLRGKQSVNRDWVDHQACSLQQYINVIANLFIKGNYFNELNALKKYKGQQSPSKGFAKFMIPRALVRKFLSYQFIVSVERSNKARCSSKTNELRDIDSIG